MCSSDLTVGTTITPWGQSFIQSYVADKGLREDDLAASRVDVFLGALLTNLIAAFIVVACAATLWTSGTTVEDAADAAGALAPHLVRAHRSRSRGSSWARRPSPTRLKAITASIAIFTSFCSIFFPRYSGVRPTISPAMKTALMANRRIP